MAFLIFAPPLTLGLLALLLRLHQGSWLAPGALAAGFWALLLFNPLIMVPHFYRSPDALWLLALLVIALALGAVLGQGLGMTVAAHPARPRLPGLDVALLATSALGLLAVVQILASRGVGLGVFIDPVRLAETGRDFSLARYEQGYVPPLLARLAMSGLYLGALLGGLRAGTGRSDRRWLALLPLIPALGVAAVLTTRAVVLWALILWLSAFFATRSWHLERPADFVDPRLLLRLMLVAVAVVVLFVVLQMVRGGVTDLRVLGGILERLQVWFFGYLGGFSVWVDQYPQDWLPGTWGGYSLAGLFQLLGLGERVQGLYQEFVNVGPGFVTNVFTLYRPLIEDFGLIGALLILGLTGLAAGWAYGQVRRGDVRWVPVLAAFYAMLAWSHVTSLFTYNSLILAYGLFTAYLWLGDRR